MTSPTPSESSIDLDVKDILAELTPRGRREFEAAQQRAICRKLQEQNAELRRELAQVSNAKNGAPVRAA